jgi:hypothetical protein
MDIMGQAIETIVVTGMDDALRISLASSLSKLTSRTMVTPNTGDVIRVALYIKATTFLILEAFSIEYLSSRTV